MSIPELDLIGIVVEDMARSLAFYGRVGLDVPAEADDQPHGEVTWPVASGSHGTRSRRSDRSIPTSRSRRVRRPRAVSPPLARASWA
jgi:hypothetical protein